MRNTMIRFTKEDGSSYPDWKECKLGDLYTERNERGNDSLPILSVSIHDGVSSGEMDEEELGKKVNRSSDKSLYKRVCPGDLAFNMMRAWQGAIGVVKNEGMISPAYIAAIPNGELYAPFMNYYMRTDRMIHIINRQSYGLTDFRKRLYWDPFVSIPCRIPCIEEQKRIADFLDHLDEQIEVQKKIVADYELRRAEILRRVFLQEIRFSNSQGEVFPAWELHELKHYLTERHEKYTGSEEVYSVSVSKGLVNQSEHLGRSFAAENLDNYKVVHYGDVIYTKSPTGKFKWGIVKQSAEQKEVVISPLYGVFIPCNYEVGYLLDQYFSSSERAHNYLITLITKGAKNTINISNDTFLSKEIALPSTEEEQKKVVAFLKTINDQISTETEILNHMEMLKKGFLQKMFI